MKAIRLLLKKPGIYFYLMFLWIWIFMIRDYMFFREYNITIDIPIINIYLIPLSLCVFGALVLNYLDLSYGFWVKIINYWFKFLILNGLYLLVLILSGFGIIFLHELNYVNYVGDIYGTIVMGFCPTLVLYVIIGVPLTIVLNHKKSQSN